MAAIIQATRQFSYQVARLMATGQGSMEASLVKAYVCRAAEWVTREALQIHGGMGYAEEFPVSRYFVDARVLSIFEGADETARAQGDRSPFLVEPGSAQQVMAVGDWDMPRRRLDRARVRLQLRRDRPQGGRRVDRQGRQAPARAARRAGSRTKTSTQSLRTRPEPDQWSALEYACHVRDVLDLNVERVQRRAGRRRPRVRRPSDRDAAVTERDYNGQDPSAVADEIDANAAALGAALAPVPDDAWDRFWVRGELGFSHRLDGKKRATRSRPPLARHRHGPSATCAGR